MIIQHVKRVWTRRRHGGREGRIVVETLVDLLFHRELRDDGVDIFKLECGEAFEAGSRRGHEHALAPQSDEDMTPLHKTSKGAKPHSWLSGFEEMSKHLLNSHGHQ